MTVVDELLAEWELVPDGEPTSVVPVRTPGGQPAVLKIGAAEHEHLALQHWHGQGAVRLLRADPHRSAVLLERVHPEGLVDHWDVEACEIVGDLYGRLHVTAPPQLPRLSDEVVRRTGRLAGAPLPRRLVEQAVALGRAFATDDGTDGRLLHTDLHYGHVLPGDRQPWLAIAPEPLSGDPHFEVAPLLWHRWDELAGDVRRGVRARFHAVIDAAGLDEDRARDWVVLRCVVRAAQEPGWVTRCIAIAKSVQE
ncbi:MULTISPECIES: aminoglycoside phosphotransferase family protein [Nocardioides]|uniref:aminoglycoside phosphotransferase family protein n=1 Tax=Nocardioides TaxID=1839 RepID=UPI0028680F57|nr:aminoglycoside phosphotransferase family protein [Nocardioides sp. CGMCC 1.13656]